MNKSPQKSFDLSWLLSTLRAPWHSDAPNSLPSHLCSLWFIIPVVPHFLVLSHIYPLILWHLLLLQQVAETVSPLPAILVLTLHPASQLCTPCSLEASLLVHVILLWKSQHPCMLFTALEELCCIKNICKSLYQREKQNKQTKNTHHLQHHQTGSRALLHLASLQTNLPLEQH